MKGVLVLAGPTSAGKTAVALAVAERFGAVVLSADAMQVYRRLDIGTGKATSAERARVPHEGLDLVEPDEPFSAGDFVTLGDRVIGAHARVIVAGGTSLYLRSLLRGLVRTPPVDPELRAELEARDDLHAALQSIDPPLAKRLHPADRVRLIRGIEVFRLSGRRLSDLHAEHACAPDRIAHRALWLDRDDLYERIDARVIGMVEAGWVAEVQAVLDAGFAPTLKPLQSLGYRHLCAHLLEGLPLDETIRRTQRDTRHFSRKQRTWMRGLGYPRLVDDPLDTALKWAEDLWGPA
ncbi:MAG: tRNA (adenosine(37)-N6)-dimethylallyltransferase MiaA [Myxococcota bacterium]